MNQREHPHYRVNGTVTKIVSHNTDTGYTFLQIKEPTPKRRTISIITHLPACHIGINMSFQGDWHFENSLPIFYAHYAYERTPKTLTDIRKYLNSGILKGISSSITQRIVAHFINNTLTILNNAIINITEIPGISEKKLTLIQDRWTEHKIKTDIMRYLQDHGLTAFYATQAYNLYGGFAQNKIQENPYRLLEDCENITFPDVDPFALSIGVIPDCEERIMAATSYLLTDCQNFGHCYLTQHQLHNRLKNLLQLDLIEALDNHLSTMVEQQLIYVQQFKLKGYSYPHLCYYEPSMFDDEFYVAQKLSQNRISPEMDRENINDFVERYQISERNLTDEQVNAAIGAVCSKYSVITGYAGTGKSSVIKAIVFILKNMAVSFHLVAPTGRAAQRLSDVTGTAAQTIHRFLGCKADGSFQYNSTNCIPTDFLIIDEASMIDIRLLSALLKALPTMTQILFIGDPDQLLPIGPGNVLHDLIKSDVMSVYQLTQVFRQNQSSLILKYAYLIKSDFTARFILGEIEAEKMSNTMCDCYFFFTKDAGCKELNDTAIEHVIKRKHYWWQPPGFMEKDQCPFDATSCYSATDFIRVLYQKLSLENDDPEIQILTPSNHGATKFNQKIQEIINPYDQRKQQLKFGNKIFRQGDRVIHCKNNYKLGVFNGEIGTIVYIGKHMACTVAYPDGRVVEYNHDDLNELDLAYAITIHKSQGSEFDIVIIAMSEQDRKLSKSLIYTAITRAKKLAVFVGYEGDFANALRKCHQEPRQTGLKELLASC